MADDRVLEGFIHNLSKSAPSEIRGYLQDARFLHASHMLEGCKSARWWKDRDLRHTFYLSCDECTITLTDIALQLSLPVDGLVITRSVIVINKEDLCETFLRKVLNKFQVIGVVVATIFMSLSGRPLYISIGDKVEPWAELRGTTGVARKYLSMWDVKVPLIVYATIEMHEPD
ncbi:hypothetical protein CXB51_007443 [Gossypium anomalum]|uniref:Uncharacterized protein n=1 Tax=Gossypium anomalum TaxID=47600 RepID=A0A8J5ZLP6_9ROSI|nr:hypothetical protein CXB51_007443 [Gossypium anomalum]